MIESDLSSLRSSAVTRRLAGRSPCASLDPIDQIAVQIAHGSTQSDKSGTAAGAAVALQRAFAQSKQRGSLSAGQQLIGAVGFHIISPLIVTAPLGVE